MANTRSAEKRMRQGEKRRVRNAAVRSGVRSAVKSVRTSLAGASVDEARAGLARTIRLLDKAVTKGILHPNAAARKKSRLARQLNALAGR
ncbi:MAG TPA: 30S ribosomal protein S20 [Methylomirabilota bacterium]|jgi:small subunit ribosomal protein S20|nr:30S ribosomal protein S20 [Methylomirabilota bacterium]